MINEFQWAEHIVSGFSTGVGGGSLIVGWLARNKIAQLFGKKKIEPHGEAIPDRRHPNYTCVFHSKFEEECEKMDKETKRISDIQIGVVTKLEGLVATVDRRFKDMTIDQNARHTEINGSLGKVHDTLMKILGLNGK